MNNPIESIKFPQYRAYKNGKSYFKILSALEFEEIQLIGSKKIVTRHNAKILPDHNFVYDLLLNYSDFAEEVSEETYAQLAGDQS
ncbi:MAG: hypothetical protein ACJ76F_13980 [Bacteroidia bacterium]